MNDVALQGHTPGPWAVEIGETFGAYIIREVAKARDSSRDVANAYLIQAAPQLLEALQFIVNDYEELAREHDESRFSSDAYLMAGAAIAKATGHD